MRTTPQGSEPAPIWLQDHLNDNQLARLLGETPAAAEPEPESEQEPEPEAEPEPDVEMEPALTVEPEPEIEPDLPSELEPEMAPETEAEEEAEADSSATTLQRAEPPPRLPTTSLGGSARELLNPDGTQR